MRFCVCLSIMLLSITSVAGCGSNHGHPELIPVSGVVTLNGTPIAGLRVNFEPSEGRRSSGVTNQSGEYVLKYMDQQKGALHGHHRVTIVWTGENENEIEGEAIPTDEPGNSPGMVIPSRYNVQSQLIADVRPHTHRFDFDLTAQRRR